MKVGICIPNSTPTSGGGYVYEQEMFGALKKEAEKTNHELVFIEEKRSIPSKILFGLIHNFFPHSPLLWKWYVWISPMEQAIRKNRIGMMIFLNPIHDPVDVPYITTIWDITSRLQPWFSVVSSCGEWCNRESWYVQQLQRATYIVAGTQTGKQEVTSLYNIPENRVEVIPFPTPSFPHEQSPYLPEEYLFYPAQFWPHKNHVNLLYALKLIREKYKIPLSLTLSGSDKGNQNYVESVAETIGIRNYVRFAGFLSREEMMGWYRNAFAMVNPTYVGPDNLPALEAISLGCPCLMSDMPGFREQFGAGALYFDPSNPEDIARRIAELYQSRELRKYLVEKAKPRMEGRDPGEVAAQFLSLVTKFENVRRCWE